MKNIKTLSFSLLVVYATLTGCSTIKPVAENEGKKIPESYTSTKDTVNSANINWKQYFTDSNLNELIDIALKNNSDLTISLQRIEAARANVRFNQNALFPSLSLNTTYLQRKFGYYTMDDAGNRTTEIKPGQIVPTHLPDYFLGFQTAWEIDVWGKLRNKKKAALSRYLSTVEGKNLIVTNLIAAVVNTYYELLSLDNKLEIIRETVQLQEKAVELISIQKQAGVANELAVKQFEAQLFNSKALEVETRQQITETENQINFLLNRYPQSVKRDKQEFTKPLPFTVNTGIPSDLLKNRPDIRQAEYELIASKADVKAAKAAFYPSLNITGLLGYQGFDAGLLFTTPQSVAYSFAGSLLTPLINRNAVKAEFKTANAFQQEALANYQKSILNGYTEVYNELTNIRNLEKINEFKAKEVVSLTQASEASSELFKTGRANYIEVLITQQNTLQSKLELIDAKQRQFNAFVNIYKALGGGWR
ncbi:MAG: efflux transporter outer membrane subunit [Bacteroidia bacterium]